MFVLENPLTIDIFLWRANMEEISFQAIPALNM